MPTPCGLGLKFTVGTAVSVSPLGLLGGVRRQRRSGGPRKEEEEEGGDRKDF